MKPKNIHGGGAKTTINGLRFERETNLITELRKVDYLRVSDPDVFFEAEKIASVSEKHRFYKKFLNPLGIDEKQILSKKLLPDAVLINRHTSDVFIIEKKFQESEGSVDEKLQTCDFKLKQYKRLLAATNYTVHFIFLLNDWFKKPAYRDVKNYIKEVGCEYYFNELPLKAIKLDQASLGSAKKS